MKAVFLIDKKSLEIESFIYEDGGPILLCEGEIDALTAILAGETGVGLPGWSHWKDVWIGDFKGKDIVLVMDADDAGRKGTRDIAGCFIRAGLPAPRQLILDRGKDLNEFYNLSKGET